MRIELPQGARFLHVATQERGELEIGPLREVPCFWVLVDPEAPLETRRFITYETGHLIGEKVHYHGTFLLQGLGLVFHVCEEENA